MTIRAGTVDYNEYWRRQQLKEIQNEAGVQLQQTGTRTYVNQRAEQYFSKPIPQTVYDLVKRSSTFQPLFSPQKSAHLPFLQLDDYYSHPIDAQGDQLMYTDSNGDIFADSTKNMPMGNWKFSKVHENNLPLSQTEDIERIYRTSFGIYISSPLQVFQVDPTTFKVTRSLDLKNRAIRSLHSEDRLLYIGRLNEIVTVDTRVAAPPSQIPSAHVIKMITTPPYLVCGSNDNKIQVFDQRNLNKPVKEYKEFTAGVRALCLDETRGSFFAGGGLNDRTIKHFNIRTDKADWSIQTKAQVLDIHTLDQHLITVHGYTQEEQDIMEGQLHNVVKLWDIKSSGLRLKGEQTLSSNMHERSLFSTIHEDVLYTADCSKGNSYLSAFKINVAQKTEPAESVFSQIMNIR